MTLEEKQARMRAAIVTSKERKRRLYLHAYVERVAGRKVAWRLKLGEKGYTLQQRNKTLWHQAYKREYARERYHLLHPAARRNKTRQPELEQKQKPQPITSFRLPPAALIRPWAGGAVLTWEQAVERRTSG